MSRFAVKIRPPPCFAGQMYTFFVHFCNKAVNTAILPLFSARDDWILRAYYVIVLSECNTDASEPCSFRAAGDPKSFDAFTKGFIFERRKNMKRVDARGLSCPEPVIQTKNAMASKEAAYEVLVDNVVAKENVSRFVLHQGYQVQVEEQGDDFLLKIMK